eukprot:TRINITY_DN111197_c0_g1_i1.p1 TRINITY_DN111197_c0_g1~~TRINITY_DN111197_c0_g1_i1.p1  ORF type:complete len:401 (-),score=97.15 TRINITY_DN111197_c0_g1_i1:65-1201(-)
MTEQSSELLLEQGRQEGVSAEEAKAVAKDIGKDTLAFGKDMSNEIGKTFESMRAASFANDLNTDADTPVKKCLKFSMIYLVKPLIIVIMIYVFIAQQLYKVYKILPVNLLQMIFGIGLCFFGGTYFMSIAAFEAFRNFGGQLLLDELAVCWEQALLVKKANEIDDTVDANQDGVVDVQQMSYNELINHKAKMAMVAIDKPDRLTKSVQYLFTAWVSVIATLKMQFARTVAIALGIADMCELPAVQVFGPVLAFLLGPDLKHWVAPSIGITIKIIAVVISTYIQAIISAFYSGLRGGRMFGTGLVYGIMPYVGPYLPECCIKQPFDPEQSYIDEMIGFPLAAAGFYYQFTHNFTLEFPYSLIMLPCTIVEWVLRWNVFT